MIAGRRRDVGENAAVQLRNEGLTASFVLADVSKAASVRSMVQACVDEYGRLDFAYNNAAVPGELVYPIADSDEDAAAQVIAVNVTGMWLCMKYEIPHILAAGGGAIVNCSSKSGLRGAPLTSAYVASKHAVIGMTKSVAMEYATRGTRLNAICPGLVMTDMITIGLADAPERIAELEVRIPMARAGEPSELGSVVTWLCSDSSSYITGAAIPVDGGSSL
jgi:NAD(P)-dependent dehydrogenase (short-subunit alcohol dehydrogenase family)